MRMPLTVGYNWDYHWGSKHRDHRKQPGIHVVGLGRGSSLGGLGCGYGLGRQ